jgi:uncharacterized protein DUF2516
MVSAAVPIFYNHVEFYTNVTIVAALAIIEIVAIINCAMQRQDAFPVVGSLSKATWMLILAGALVLTVACTLQDQPYFGFLAVTAAGIYLLDVRPALRDATDGTGSW